MSLLHPRDTPLYQQLTQHTVSVRNEMKSCRLAIIRQLMTISDVVAESDHGATTAAAAPAIKLLST